uniref:phage portal protein family protein n=1 Tax=Enterococcus faecium TaxID=1352 RepID=UPI0034E9608E
HISCDLGKRRRAIVGLDWNIKAPRNASPLEQRDADMLGEIIDDATWFYDLLFDFSDAILKGFSPNELQWDYVEKQQIITGYEFRDQNIFKTHPDNRNQLMLNDGSAKGEQPNPFAW